MQRPHHYVEKAILGAVVPNRYFLRALKKVTQADRLIRYFSDKLRQGNPLYPIFFKAVFPVKRYLKHACWKGLKRNIFQQLKTTVQVYNWIQRKIKIPNNYIFRANSDRVTATNRYLFIRYFRATAPLYRIHTKYRYFASTAPRTDTLVK